MVGDLSREALIVGAGVVGLAIARELHRRGLDRITVIDRGAVGRESSFAAAGMLAVQAETDAAGPFFDLCRAARDGYPEFAARLFDETGTDIELDRSGTLYLAFADADDREIQHRFDWQSRAGLNVERLSAPEIRRIEPFVSPDVRGGLYFPDDWQVENRRLVAALERYCTSNGITVAENTECRRLLVRSGRVIGVEAPTGKIYAQRTVLAAGAWTSLIASDGIEMPEVRPIRGQIIGFHTAKRLFSHVIYSPRGYLVPRADGRLIAGATVEDVGFDDAVTRSGIGLVSENAFEISPVLSGLSLSEKIAGLRPRTADGLPLIGSFPQVENLFVATAHYRNGILLAPLTASLMADIVTDGRVPALAAPFGVDRFAEPAN
jgi:glycine oxidase